MLRRTQHPEDDDVFASTGHHAIIELRLGTVGIIFGALQVGMHRHVVRVINVHQELFEESAFESPRLIDEGDVVVGQVIKVRIAHAPSASLEHVNIVFASHIFPTGHRFTHAKFAGLIVGYKADHVGLEFGQCVGHITQALLNQLLVLDAQLKEDVRLRRQDFIPWHFGGDSLVCFLQTLDEQIQRVLTNPHVSLPAPQALSELVAAPDGSFSPATQLASCRRAPFRD